MTFLVQDDITADRCYENRFLDAKQQERVQHLITAQKYEQQLEFLQKERQKQTLVCKYNTRNKRQAVQKKKFEFGFTAITIPTRPAVKLQKMEEIEFQVTQKGSVCEFTAVEDEWITRPLPRRERCWRKQK